MIANWMDESLFFRNTNFSITVNYDADNFFQNSWFPDIEEFPNGTRELVWVNQGTIVQQLQCQSLPGGCFIYLGINETYWSAGQYLVAEINGSMYNKFLSWAAQVESIYCSNLRVLYQINGSHPYYNMFSTRNSWSSNPWLSSWDCFDFAFLAMDTLYGTKQCQ
jgi:hypothetical protein